MGRRTKRSGSSGLRLGNYFLALNLGVVAILGGWYAFQAETRQHEVRRLVENAFEKEKRVSVLDVAWDIWQLYYADNSTAKVATGDKMFVYAGAPTMHAGSAAGTLRVLTNRGYVVGYNEALSSPAWVAYHLRDIGRLPTPKPRPDKFEVDRRTIARVGPEDYSNSGYDRGHLAPNYAIATRFGEDAQRETFLMSNITPQLHALNAGVWKELEMKIATNYPARYGEVWVFAGPVFTSQSRHLRHGVRVPDEFFMIMLDEQDGKLRTLSFLIPQTAPAGVNPGDYLTTVAEIQKRTGLDFFSELDDVSEVEVENQRGTRVW
ncbi:MAG: DNA/RNA non-specific endonuclease [Opitutaceae bacterium]